MSKLGLRLGWSPPPAFQLSDDFSKELEAKIFWRFRPSSIEKLEAACNNLMNAKRSKTYEAEGVPTRKILERWADLYAKLYDALREPLSRRSCEHLPDRGWYPEIAAAQMAMARCSDSQKCMKLPDLDRHLAEIEAMRYLTARAQRDVEASISFGPGGNEPIRRWISDIADIFEREGIALTTPTRRGPRTSQSFTAVLELLRAEMSPGKFEPVRLPSKKQLVELSRDILNSRPHVSRRGKKPRPQKSRQKR